MSHTHRCQHHPTPRAVPCEQCMTEDLVGFGSQFDPEVMMHQDPRITMTVSGRPSIPPPQPTAAPCPHCDQQHSATRPCFCTSRHSEHHTPSLSEKEDVSYQETYNPPWSPCQPHVPGATERVLETHERNLPRSRGAAPRDPAMVRQEAGRDVVVPRQIHPLTEGNLRRHLQQFADFTARRANSTTVQEEPAEDANGDRGHGRDNHG